MPNATKKPTNTLETRKIRISSNGLIEYYLEKATETGFYGNNPTDTASILVGRALEQLVIDKVIPSAPSEILEAARKKPG